MVSASGPIRAGRSSHDAAFASVPIPKFAAPCGKLNANFGIERALAKL
jgi:hypothetical protein